MRGKTLDALLDDYRAEIRVSLNPAMNVQQRESQIKRIQQAQDWLHTQYDWPHMRIARKYPLQSGQRYYDFSADFDIERINSITVRNDGVWQPLAAGICDADYAFVDSDLDHRQFPTERWALAEDDQIEFWPISDRNGNASDLEGYVQVHGIKKLDPLIEENDRAELDNWLIVWYAAAEHLGAEGAKDAKLILDKANARFARLRAQQTKVKGFRMYGVGERASRTPFDAMNTYKPPVNR